MAENKTLNAIQTLGGNYPTLKAIAIAMDVPYVRLHAVSKQPQQGVVYDRNVFNWEAIDRFITRRLDPDKGFATVEGVIEKALEVDVELKEADGRKRANAGRKTVTLSDGTEVPARKVDYQIGEKVQIKKDESGKTYEVVYSTISHLVLKDTASEVLLVMSNNTANWRLKKAEEAKPAETAEATETAEA